MSWEEDLVELYDKNADHVGEVMYRAYGKTQVPYVLIPPFHTTVTAQINVILDETGNFLDASAVAEEDKMTIIPVTEKSGSRTAGKEPHPLCDNLKYLAGDYDQYVPDKKGALKEFYTLYIEALEKWHSSFYTHPKVDAVYKYLKKGTLMRDLIEKKVLKYDENGLLSDKIKIQNVSQLTAFVRFTIRSPLSLNASMDETPQECWKDPSLWDCFIQYYREQEGEKSLDYLTGHMEAPSYLHSKKIRNEGDGAKLISSNDESTYTFRGRFLTKEQAFAIGGETSHKMHNALKWIIRRQGESFDSLMMVTWESDLKEMPDWTADTEQIGANAPADSGSDGSGSDGSVSGLDLTINFDDVVMEDPEQDNFYGPGQESSDFTHQENSNLPGNSNSQGKGSYDSNLLTAKAFYSALNGYKRRVEHTGHMILMAFDAATTGRLCLAEYKKLDDARYLTNIEKWHSQCGWIHWKYKNGKRQTYYGMTGVRDIADILYGIESNGILTIVDKNSKKMYAAVSQKLLPCIWDGSRLPFDLVNLAVVKASSPLSYKDRHLWERVLSLACSFVKKYRYDQYNKEEWNVALNLEEKNRSYLYGRLLAVADRIEYRTYDQDQDSGRVTNAKRYMNTFSQRPFDTWKIIEENVQPYLNKLKINERKYYERTLDEIYSLFDIEGYQDNTRLDGLYLLGFHSQSYAMKQPKFAENEGGEKK